MSNFLRALLDRGNIGIYIRPAALFVAMALSATPSHSDEPAPLITSAQFDQNVDQLWPKIVRFLAMRSVNPTKLDKDQGILAATGISLGPNDLKCQTGRGLGDDAYNLSIVLDRQGGAKTSVTVFLTGSANLIRNRHFLMFKTSRVKTPVACLSTGSFERALFEYLAE
jgi:hypothetical protein